MAGVNRKGIHDPHFPFKPDEFFAWLHMVS